MKKSEEFQKTEVMCKAPYRHDGHYPRTCANTFTRKDGSNPEVENCSTCAIAEQSRKVQRRFRRMDKERFER